MATEQKYTTISVVETRNEIGRILEDVYYNNRKYMITRRNKPYAMITNLPISQLKKEGYKKPLENFLKLSSRITISSAKKKLDINEIMQDERKDG